MDEKSHYKANDVYQQLHALVVRQFDRLVDLTDDIGEAVAEVLIVHQLQQVPFLLDLDRN